MQYGIMPNRGITDVIFTVRELGLTRITQGFLVERDPTPGLSDWPSSSHSLVIWQKAYQVLYWSYPYLRWFKVKVELLCKSLPFFWIRWTHFGFSGIESECGITRLFVWLTVTDVSLDCPSPTPPAAASLNCWVPVTTLFKPGLGLCGTAGCGSFHLASLRPSQHTSEPRLYRKTFLLRKRGSQPKLQASSVPVIPGKFGSTTESWVGLLHTMTLFDFYSYG